MTELIFKNQREEDVKQLARVIANVLTAPSTLLLFGDLGAGKSTFARFLIKALTFENMVVPSPTFTLLQSYDTSKGPLTHFDLYRLSSSEEIIDLGWEDYIQYHMCLVEWPERLDGHYPTPHMQIHFEEMGEKNRNLRMIFNASTDFQSLYTLLQKLATPELLRKPF